MLSKTAVKLNKSVCERARRAAEALGYSSREEFIEHAIEKESQFHEMGYDAARGATNACGIGEAAKDRECA